MTLIDIAFGVRAGDDPALVDDRSPAPTGHERWLQAVALIGQGHYRRALTELFGLCRPRGAYGSDDPAITSAALAAAAACARQRGDHRRAAAVDGQALRTAAAVGGGPDAGPSVGRLSTGTLMIDALVGLAADHLGMGDLGGAGRLLDRAERAAAHLDLGREASTIEDWTDRHRPVLRIRWVRAELGLYSGDVDRATDHAAAARTLARACASVRHVAKTDMIVAATHAAAGRTDEAVQAAVSCRDRAAEHGLWPLRWATGRLLSTVPGIDTAMYEADVVRTRDVLNRRGGVF